MTSNTQITEYYRRDQRAGISPPDPSKACSFAEHIVRARGKRTNFTSVSLDPTKITDFGEVTYKLRQSKLQLSGHALVEHQDLVEALRITAESSDKADRLLALRAIRYARRRQEGLVCWKFKVGSIAAKDLINWAKTQVAPFFGKVK